MKVVRSSLRHAASVSSLMLTTEAMIAEDETAEKEPTPDLAPKAR